MEIMNHELYKNIASWRLFIIHNFRASLPRGDTGEAAMSWNDEC